MVIVVRSSKELALAYLLSLLYDAERPLYRAETELPRTATAQGLPFQLLKQITNGLVRGTFLLFHIQLTEYVSLFVSQSHSIFFSCTLALVK